MLKAALYVVGGIVAIKVLMPDLWKKMQYNAGEWAAKAAINAARSKGGGQATGDDKPSMDADQITAEILAAPFAQGALRGLAESSGNAFLQQFVTDLITPAEQAG
jgi:hypothetical protein